MHPRQRRVQSGYDSETSVVLLGIDDSSDSEQDAPTDPNGYPSHITGGSKQKLAALQRLAALEASQISQGVPTNHIRYSKGVPTLDGPEMIAASPSSERKISNPLDRRKEAAVAKPTSATRKKTAAKTSHQPLLVEVFSKRAGGWVMGHVARRKVPGCIVVKFDVGGMPHIKTLKANSRHLRMPEGIQNSCREFVFNNNSSVLAMVDDEDDVDPETKIKRHDKLARIELRHVLVSHQNSKFVPIAETMEFRWISYGAFASKSHVGWTGFWDIRYVGPTDEDVVLKIFRSTHQKHVEDYECIGVIHAMQFGSRSVRMLGSTEEYYVGLEIHTGLNDTIFYGMSLHLQRRHLHRCLEMMMLDRPCKHRAEQSDFLVCLSKDAAINHMLMWRLQQYGTRSGPWGNEKRDIPICTDASLGLGLHFEDSVEISLGGRCFGRPCTTDTWFAELAEAAKQTTYGILTLDAESMHYYQSAPGWIDVRRQYFYYQETDSLISRREQHKYMLQSAPHLSLAASRGDVAEADDVMQRDVQAKQAEDERQRTPLHYAALHGHIATISQLLSVSADVESWSTAGNTPLHLAAVGGHEAVAGLLVRGGADANSRDFSGRSPLHFAAIGGHAWMTELLLSAGADVHIQDLHGDTPLDFAMTPGPDVQHHPGHVHVKEMLRKIGAEQGKALRAAWELASATGGGDDQALAEALDTAKNDGVGSLLVDAAEARQKRNICQKNLSEALNNRRVPELRRALRAACDVGVDVKLTSFAETNLTKLIATTKITECVDTEDLIGLREALVEARQVGADPDAIIAGEESSTQIVLKRKLKQATKKGPELLEKVLQEVYDEGVQPNNMKEAELDLRRLRAAKFLRSPLQLQDGSLQRALTEAKFVGVDSEELVAAQSRVDLWECENALKDAMQTSDDDMLLRALTSAKKIGASDSLVAAAKEKLSKLVLANKLAEASKGEDVIAVETILAEAFAAGVDSATLEEGKASLKRIELADQLLTSSTSEQLTNAIEQAELAAIDLEKVTKSKKRLQRLLVMEEISAALEKRDVPKLRKAVKERARDAGLEPSALGESVEALKRLEAEAGLEQAIQSENVDLLSSNLVDARQSGASATSIGRGLSHLKRLRLEETLELASKCKDASILEELILPAQEAGVSSTLLEDARYKMKGVVATSELEKAMLSEDAETLDTAIADAKITKGVDTKILDEAQKHLQRLRLQQKIKKAAQNEDASSLEQLILEGRKLEVSPPLLIAARQALRKLKS